MITISIICSTEELFEFGRTAAFMILFLFLVPKGTKVEARVDNSKW